MSEEKIPYEVLKPISYKGDRIEKGSIVSMTAEEAENIGDEFLVPAEESDTSEVPAEPANAEGNAGEFPENPEKPEDEDGEQTETDEGKPSEETDDTQTGNQPEETV